MSLSRRTRSLLTPLIAALLVGVICDQSVAAQVGGGDKLIEAATYFAQADKEKSCSLENARDLTKRALSTAKSYRSSSPAERDKAGNFIAKCNLKLKELDERERSLQVSKKLIEKDFKGKRLESAQNEFTTASPPTCDAGFKKLEDAIKEGHDSASQRVAQADSLVQEDPKQALSIYSDALRSDAEFPGIRERMQKAADIDREQERQKHQKKVKAPKQSAGHHKASTAAKVIVFTLIMVAVVGVVIWAAQQANKQNQ